MRQTSQQAVHQAELMLDGSAPGAWRRALGLLYWTLPLVLCLLLFRRGLFSWFQQDDFSWLRLEIHSFTDFWRLLVEPRAQGTIRPLSERFFFILFRWLFGLNALPYRIFVFLTQFANLILLTELARRIIPAGLRSHSQPSTETAFRIQAEPLIAPVVWTVNIGLLTPMVWTSAYNQVLCAFLYLSSLLLFVQHLETGRWSYYFWQCGTFLLGFGALESIVAYPLVLLAYCLVAARAHVWKVLPLGIASALYAGLHLWAIPPVTSGPYALHLDWSVFTSLWSYWTWALGPPRWAQAFGMPAWTGFGLVLLLMAGLVTGLARASRKERRIAIFGLAWFVATLAPVLPLRDHRLDYYVTIPAIGLALAVASLATRGRRVAVALWLAIYLACSIAFVEKEIRPLYRRSQMARRFLEAVQQARALHPDKTILLTDVSDLLFYAVIYDEGPRTAGVRGVYLAPTNEGIGTRPGLLPVDAYQLPERATLAGLQQRQVVVYQVSETGLRNITTRYRLSAPDLLHLRPPRRVQVGEPLLADQLGPGWYGIQGQHRWMSRRAVIRLAAPRSPSERLRIEAFYPAHLNPGTFHLTVQINDIPVGRVEIHDQSSARHVFVLPPAVIGLEEMTITLEVDRTFRVTDDVRELGLAFGVVELI